MGLGGDRRAEGVGGDGRGMFVARNGTRKKWGGKRVKEETGAWSPAGTFV